jgi:hypothetical protein
MGGESGLFAGLASIASLGAGVYLALSTFWHRAYVKSLPPSPGNLTIKREHAVLYALGMLMIALGVWRTYQWLMS